MTALLILVAIAVTLYGLTLATEVTAGVAIISIGLLFAVLARIVQADAHQRALLKAVAGKTAPLPGAPE